MRNCSVPFPHLSYNATSSELNLSEIKYGEKRVNGQFSTAKTSDHFSCNFSPQCYTSLH